MSEFLNQHRQSHRKIRSTRVITKYLKLIDYTFDYCIFIFPFNQDTLDSTHETFLGNPIQRKS